MALESKFGGIGVGAADADTLIDTDNAMAVNAEMETVNIQDTRRLTFASRHRVALRTEANVTA
jgi:hypothetical protein